MMSSLDSLSPLSFSSVLVMCLAFSTSVPLYKDLD